MSWAICGWGWPPRCLGILAFLFVSYHLLHRVLGTWGPRWGIRSLDDWASLPVLILTMSVFTFLSSPVSSAYSRMLEHNADIYGLEVIHGVVPDSSRVAAESFQILGEVGLVGSRSEPVHRVLDVRSSFDPGPGAVRVRVRSRGERASFRSTSSDACGAGAHARRIGTLADAYLHQLGFFSDATAILERHRPNTVHLFFGFERHGKLLFDLFAEDRTGVVGAERIDQAVGRGVVDHAALHALHVVVVRVHEVHAGQHQGAVGEALLLAFAAAVASCRSCPAGSAGTW